MNATMLDGKTLARQIEEELKGRVAQIKTRTGGIPVLATILVGDDPASATYVRKKGNACRRVGMESRSALLPGQTTTAELLGEIEKLDQDGDVQEILLQHPVPRHIDERQCFDRIAIDKGVDGVTALGFGRMSLNEPAYGLATPAGIMTLLQHYNITIEGKHAVIAGRSLILGKPMAMMLMNANATITVCHSKTRSLAELVHEADIVVGAVGKPEYIRAKWVRDGAVVIDAGYHQSNVGDIEVVGVVDRCSAYTPVPGGVGPMTIAMLITHTVDAAEKGL